MSPDVEKYSEVRKELQEVVLLDISLSEKTSGRRVSEWRHEQASIIFSKICSHGLSAFRLAPTGLIPAKPGSKEHWDISSLCAVVRSVVDAYFVMYYLAVDRITHEERSFREALWVFYGENKRLKLLGLAKSKLPELARIKGEVERRKNVVLQHPIYKTLRVDQQREARKGNLPLHLSNSDLCLRAGIHPDYYRSVYRHLSSYIHTLQNSIDRLKQKAVAANERLERTKKWLGIID